MLHLSQWFQISLLLSMVVGSPAEATASEEDGPHVGMAVGEVFPDLVLPSMEDATPVSLSQFRGQKVILHVFASW